MMWLRPAWLWLLVLVVPLVLAHWNGRFGLAGPRAVAVVLVRTILVVLVVLALAQPVWERADDAATIVAVVDVSPSVSDADLSRARQAAASTAAQLPAGDAFELVTFAGHARQVELADRQASAESIQRFSNPASDAGNDVEAEGSALAEALDLANALIPRNRRGRVLVYTDGLATHGDTLNAACRLARRGIPIEVEPTNTPPAGDVLVRDARLPASAALGATLPLEVEIEAATAGPAEVAIRRGDDAEQNSRRVELSSGRQRLRFDVVADRVGTCTYHVEVRSAQDTEAANNTADASVHVAAARSVIVLEDDPAAPVAEALQRMLVSSGRVKPMAPNDSASVLEALTDASLVVLGDVPAASLPQAVQERIKSAVSEGMGLLVTGGRRSLAAGGYADAAISAVLPVQFSQEVERRDPSSTLVIIIDTSGSMGAERVNLAKEIARLAIARLQAHDKVGIVEFYGSKRWAAPIQPATNAIEVQRALNRLQSGGGTVILPAIEEAYYALRNVQTRTRHVLVLTDGGVETGAFEPLIRKMAESRITVSTVLVGPGAHSSFLANLANWGHGRFYNAPDRFALPEIIIKQPESSLLAPYVDGDVYMASGRPAPLTDDVDLAAAPALQGYARLQARPTADVLITCGGGDALLTTWQYGLGRVGVFASQLAGEWSEQLAQWEGYGPFVASLCRGLQGTSADQTLKVEPIVRHDFVELRISDRAPSRQRADAALDLEIAREDTTHARTLDPIRPHEWNCRLGPLPAGTYTVRAMVPATNVSGAAAFTVMPPREYSALEPDHALLAELEGVYDRFATAKADPMTSASRVIELWPALLATALILLLLNVLIRRWPDRVTASAGAAAMLLVWVLAAEPRFAAAATTAPADAETPHVTSVHDWKARLDRGASAETWQDALTRYKAVRTDLLRADGNIDRLLVYLQERVQSPDGAQPYAMLMLAEAARDAGKPQLAGETLKALTSRPDCPQPAWLESAATEELLGDIDAALNALEQVDITAMTAQDGAAIGIRRAQLLYESNDPQAAGEQLRAVAAATPNDVLRAYCGYLASLHGDAATAAAMLAPPDGDESSIHQNLLAGLNLLRLDRPQEAEEIFRRAYGKAVLVRDRRFAVERITHAAWQAGRLEQLAREWMAEPQPAIEKRRAVVAILRELDRAEEALAYISRFAGPTTRPAGEADEIRQEMIALAMESGRTRDVESSLRKLIEQDPDHAAYRVSLARLYLLENRAGDAVRLFDDSIRRTNDPGALMALAQGADRLALTDAALRASRKASTAGGEYRVASVLFEAEVMRQSGRSDEAFRLLEGLASTLSTEPAALQRVAETFERYGNKPAALELYRQIHAATGAEDTLLRLAGLLEELHRYGEACDAWKQLWLASQVPARQRQASERLLDLAARAGRLADLAIELEERLDAGQADSRELSLLVDIYTKAQDPVSAAEILSEFSRRGGDRVEQLQRLARVYMSCDLFGRCQRVLERLSQLDPGNAADYLQQIAMVAVERRQPREARLALARLDEIEEGEAAIDEEFAAGIYSLLGMHEQAARDYHRALVRRPDHIEGWLLWGNAMAAAGHREQALARFQVLLDEASQDDLFTVGVDGLLNLDASPSALRFALRRIIARIAAGPGKLFLYRLASDVYEALNEPDRASDMLEQGVIVAGGQRPALLRELMTAAGTSGMLEEQVAFGRSLLALGLDLPPSALLELGEAMIAAGDYRSAEHVFSRAARLGDYMAVQQRVADYYDDANMPEVAERIIRELLISERDNVALLVRAGGLNEQLGKHAQAADCFYRAVRLLLARLPGSLDVTASATADGTTATSFGRPRRSGNLDEYDQHFEGAATGLLSCTRDDDARVRLASDTAALVASELARLQAAGQHADTIAGNPRLERLCRFLRWVAFAVHEPEAADEIDRRLVGLYPSDQTLREDIVRTRLEWGLLERAEKMSAGLDEARQPEALRVARLASDSSLLEAAIEAGTIDAKLAWRLIGRLMLEGRDEESRRVLASIPVGDTSPGNVAVKMIAVASIFDDREVAREWSDAWLDELARQPEPSVLLTELRRCLDLAWSLMTADERQGLLHRLSRMADSLSGPAAFGIHLLRLDLAESLGVPFDGSEKLTELVVEHAGNDIDGIMRVLQINEPQRRTALLEEIVVGCQPTGRRALLAALAGRWSLPVDEPLMAAFERLFRTAPAVRLSSKSPYASLSAGSWHRNPRRPELGARLGEILLGGMPDSLPVQVAVATARARAGHADSAMSLALQAVDALGSVKELSFDHQRMLDDLLETLPAAGLEELAADVTDRLDLEGPTPTLHFLHGLLLQALDRPGEAVAAFGEAFALQPSNRLTSRRLIAICTDQGRIRELADLLAAHLRKHTIMESYEWRTLTDCYVQLHRPDRAAHAAARVDTPLAAIEVMRVDLLRDRPDRVRSSFVRFLARNRDDAKFYTPFWPDPPSPGGMIGFLRELSTSPWDRPRMLEALAHLPFTETDYEAMLTAAPPDRRDVDGLVRGLAEVARVKHEHNAIGGLLAMQKNAELNAKDRRLLLAVAGHLPEVMPSRLAGVESWASRIDPWDADVLTALWRYAEARGDSGGAYNAMRSLLALELAGGTPARQGRFVRMDALVGALPAEQRDQARENWLDRLAPTPVTPLSTSRHAQWLDRLMLYGDAEALSKADDMIRQRLSREGFDEVALEVRASLARAAAIGGELDTFAREANAVLERLFSGPRTASPAINPGDMLPSGGKQSEPLLRILSEQLDAATQSGQWTSSQAERVRYLLAGWCAREKLIAQGRALLEPCLPPPEADEPTGGWLWMADALRALGDADGALSLERRLCEADMLPVMRMPSVFDEIEAARGADAADALALRVAGYSDLPAVLRRAINAARRSGSADVDALTKRLKQAVASSPE